MGWPILSSLAEIVAPFQIMNQPCKGDWCEFVEGCGGPTSLMKPGSLFPMGGIYAEVVTLCHEHQLEEGCAVVHELLPENNLQLASVLAIGVPIFIAGKLHAVLAFRSPLQKERQSFSAREKALLRLTAQWLEGELERKHAEEDRRRIFSLSNDLLAVIDFNGGFKDANPAWESILGFTRDEIMDSTFINFFHAEDSPMVRSYIAQLLAGRRVKACESRFLCKDGSLRWMSWNAVPFLQEQTIYLAAHDVTEIKNTENALRTAKEVADQSNRSKGEFLSCMSHEVKTPLNAIIGMADLLEETTLEREQQNYLAILRRASLNLYELMDDILNLARIESEFVNLEHLPFELESVVQRIRELQNPHAFRKGLSFHCVINGDVPLKLMGDPKALMQILMNLVGNAVKYTEKGFVTLRVGNDPRGSTPGALLFSVSDTGIGIPSDKLDHIFERFTQVDSSLTRRYGGTGLGLAICKRLAELMGGEIWVESEVGKGSTFYISLRFEAARSVPRVPERPALTGWNKEPAAQNQGHVPAPEVERVVRVLLVEDSADNQLLMQAFLKPPHYHVDVAENGRIGVQKFCEGTYDVVIMDIQMPVMDGYSATQAIRMWEKEQNREAIPIIALSANSMKEDIDKSRIAGCTTHLGKPPNFRYLREIIHRCLRKEALPVPVVESLESRNVVQDSQKSGQGDDANVIPLGSAIRRMVPVFLANRAKDISKARASLNVHDFESIRLIGHSMKGSGRSYGFPAISELGARLEDAAQLADPDGVRKELQALGKWLDSTKFESSFA
jgi:PAS domain S-box-containing protein